MSRFREVESSNTPSMGQAERVMRRSKSVADLRRSSPPPSKSGENRLLGRGSFFSRSFVAFCMFIKQHKNYPIDSFGEEQNAIRSWSTRLLLAHSKELDHPISSPFASGSESTCSLSSPES